MKRAFNYDTSCNFNRKPSIILRVCHKRWKSSISSGPNLKILLSLDSETYISHFDLGRKLGQCCIQNHCIAGKHGLIFVKTCLFIRRPSRYIIPSIQGVVYSDKYQNTDSEENNGFKRKEKCLFSFAHSRKSNF